LYRVEECFTADWNVCSFMHIADCCTSKWLLVYESEVAWPM